MTAPIPKTTEAPAAQRGEPDPTRRPLTEHLVELRGRLIWSFVALAAAMGVCFMYVEPIYGFLVAPLAEAMGPESTNRLIYTGLTEAFFTYMKVAFFAGFFVTFPFIGMQFWRFAAPGLYARERNAFLPFLAATPVLFAAGGAFVYYLVMPMAWRFFLGFQSTGAETALPIQLEARVGEYLDLVMVLVIAFGVCFQMPVVFALLARAGMLTAAALRRARRFASVGIFVVAAIITPPDVLSQFLLAVPLMGLYEISILLVAGMERRRREPA